jgi:NAD(P)-dependent dehydrogenase (short-subunit alcohol dehydrogenase family)
VLVELQDKVALVTGASRGVGAATAVALAQAGCHVACAARSTAEAPQKTPGVIDDTVSRVRELGREALAIQANLAVDTEVESMVRTTYEHFGRIDILINNAAISFPGDLDIALKRYDLMMKVNVLAPLIAMRDVAVLMQERGEGGAIVNVSSIAALYPFQGQMVYGMSKIALERLTVDAAMQLHEHGIAVNSFRIDIPVASEGSVANSPGLDHSRWEPSEVAAEGILWLLQRPSSYSGNLLSMLELREQEGIMSTRVANGYLTPHFQSSLVNGLVPREEAYF